MKRERWYGVIMDMLLGAYLSCLLNIAESYGVETLPFVHPSIHAEDACDDYGIDRRSFRVDKPLLPRRDRAYRSYQGY